MDDLRKHINLFESLAATDDSEIVASIEEGSEEVSENVVVEDDEAILEFTTDMDGDAGLEGALDPRALAKLLPEVDELSRFVNAVRKVQKGDIASLSMLETRQLAKAFISLLKDDSQMTMKVLQRLRMVHAKDEAPEI